MGSHSGFPFWSAHSGFRLCLCYLGLSRLKTEGMRPAVDLISDEQVVLLLGRCQSTSVLLPIHHRYGSCNAAQLTGHLRTIRCVTHLIRKKLHLLLLKVGGYLKKVPTLFLLPLLLIRHSIHLLVKSIKINFKFALL